MESVNDGTDKPAALEDLLLPALSDGHGVPRGFPCTPVSPIDRCERTAARSRTSSRQPASAFIAANKGTGSALETRGFTCSPIAVSVQRGGTAALLAHGDHRSEARRGNASCLFSSPLTSLPSKLLKATKLHRARTALVWERAAKELGAPPQPDVSPEPLQPWTPQRGRRARSQQSPNRPLPPSLRPRGPRGARRWQHPGLRPPGPPLPAPARADVTARTGRRSSTWRRTRPHHPRGAYRLLPHDAPAGHRRLQTAAAIPRARTTAEERWAWGRATGPPPPRGRQRGCGATRSLHNRHGAARAGGGAWAGAGGRQEAGLFTRRPERAAPARRSGCSTRRRPSSAPRQGGEPTVLPPPPHGRQVVRSGPSRSPSPLR